MLTNAAVKAARPRAAAFKLSGERGLHLFVAPNGRKTFRLRFRWAGREQLLTNGGWPEISLDVARAQACAAREQLDRGEDPRTASVAVQVCRFDEVDRRWHAHMLSRRTAVHASTPTRASSATGSRDQRHGAGGNQRAGGAGAVARR